MKPILTCASCHCAHFKQVERRVTGVVIDDGQVSVKEPLEQTVTTHFVCRRCGTILPRDKANGLKFEAQAATSN